MTIRSNEISPCDEMCCVSKGISRNRRETMHGFREIVGAWLLLHQLPQKLLWWQAGLVNIVSRWGVQIWPRPCERSKGVSSLWPYQWEMLGASLESACQGSLCWLLILSPRTVASVSAYRPDYLFQTVIGIWRGHPADRVKLKTYRTDYW